LKITQEQKNKFIQTFLSYSIIFLIIKLIMDRGNPEAGWSNLILTAVLFGLIMGFVNFFINRRKKSKK